MNTPLCCIINPYRQCQLCREAWCEKHFPQNAGMYITHMLGTYPKLDWGNEPRLFWFCPEKQTLLKTMDGALTPDLELQSRPVAFAYLLAAPSQERISLDTKENV